MRVLALLVFKAVRAGAPAVLLLHCCCSPPPLLLLTAVVPPGADAHAGGQGGGRGQAGPHILQGTLPQRACA